MTGIDQDQELFNVPPTESVQDQMAPEVYSCPTEISASATTWPETVCDDQNFGTYGQLGLGVLDINWLSPQYQNTIDLNALMDGFAVNQALYNTQPEEPSLVETPNELMTMPIQQQSSTAQLQITMGVEPDPGTVQSSSIAGSFSSNNSVANKYYVDGAGARAPFGGRTHNREAAGSPVSLQDTQFREGTSPQLAQISNSDPLCPLSAYDNMVRGVMAVNDAYSLHVEVADLPTYQQMQLCVRNYFEYFHPVFPFLRRFSFPDDAGMEWLLLLAVAVTGSRYIKRIHDVAWGTTLCRTLTTILRERRYGLDSEQDIINDNDTFLFGEQFRPTKHLSLRVLQAGILNIIYMLHSGRSALTQRAFVERHYLVEACHALQLLAEDSEGHNLSHPGTSARKWLARESELRTGLMIWVCYHCSLISVLKADLFSFWTRFFYLLSMPSR